MEYLNKEVIKNKEEKDFTEDKETSENTNDEDKKNESSEEKNEDEKIKTDIMTSDFTETIELTEEEKKLRKAYLKKPKTKEALIRSLILGKDTYLLKIALYFYGIISQLIDLKEISYKSEAINAITEKNYEKFIDCLKRHIISTLCSKLLCLLHSFIIPKLVKKFQNRNVLLENILLKKDIEFFDLFKTGELTNKISQHSDFPYFDIIGTIMDILHQLVKLLWLGYRLYKDFFELSLIAIGILVFQILVEPFTNNNLVDESFNEKMEQKHNYINDILSNIRLIKSFGTEKKELKRLYNVNLELEKKSFLLEIINEIYSYSFTVNEVIIFFVIGKKAIFGEKGYGELLVFETYSRDFTFGLKNIKEEFRSIKGGIHSWKRFLEIYDIEQKIVSRKNLIPIKSDEKNINNGLSIEFKDISFSYPTKKSVTIVQNLYMRIDPGKTIAIVGSSGSGKTTLSYLLLRLYDVDKGDIIINGLSIKDINLEWLRQNIGIVSQEPVLTSGTIKENILYGVDNYTEKKFYEVCKLANVYSFVTDKKLFPKEFDTIVGERGIKVSGGQKQRIAIARALMKDAKILIFDEATSALDAENEALVQEAINNVIQMKNITTIIIAHRLSTIKDANVIYVMNHGKIVESGRHDELIKMNGEYKKLVQRQLVS